MKKYIKIARIDHWIKNIFILPGIVVAFLLVDRSIHLEKLYHILAGFLATCLIASANYVINEWLDAEFDQYHPVKKYRPVVTLNMKGPIVAAEYGIFAVLGLALAWTVDIPFLVIELWLLAMGIVYNVKPLRTKDLPYLDVLSESVNNIIRLLLGWFMITDQFLPPISLVIGYWMAGAFLMGTKRLAEYRMIGDAAIAGLYRRSFRYYTQGTLLCSSFFYAMCATFCMGIFMVKYRVEYIVAIPVMLLLFAYYLMLAFKEDSVVQKPEKLYLEKKLLGLVVLFGGVLLLFTFIDVPYLQGFHNPVIVELGRCQ